MLKRVGILALLICLGPFLVSSLRSTSLSQPFEQSINSQVQWIQPTPLTPYEAIQLIVQVIGIVAIVLTLVVYYGQLRTMAAQLDAMRNASSAQNMLDVALFLQAPEVRASREVVRRRLSNKRYDSWNTEDKRDAARVCATYDAAAVIIRLGLTPLEPFVDNWGPSIRHCYQVTKPYIEELQRPENSGPRYWNDFGWLYEQVMEFDKTT